MNRAILLIATLWAISPAIACAQSAPAPFAADTAAEGTAFVRRETSVRGQTIRYYVAPAADGPRPLLVLVQGSGCEPLFARGADGLSATAGQDIVQQMAAGRFAVMVVEKPDVASEGAGVSDGTADACGAAFNRSHALDPWTQTLSRAIDAAQHDRNVVQRGAGVRVMGLSEGAIVAAHLAAQRRDVSHVSFISGFGCNQWRDVLVVARRDAATPEAAAAALSETQEGLRAVAEAPNATDQIWNGQTHLFWSTFGRACPASDLLASRAQVFVATGTADEQIDANGVEAITAAFLERQRPIRVHRVIGGSHVLDTPGSGNFANLLGVFAESLDWMAAP